MMNMMLKKSSTMVVPAEDTPKKTLWLSRLDMIIRQPYSHTRILYIYPHNTRKNTTFFDTDKLKESLSKALVPFYPMAGRLRINESNGRYEINCNEEGVLFSEIETTCTLDEFKADDELRDNMVPVCEYSKGLDSMPLCMVQLTRFKCGGVCLGIATHHHVTDGVSDAHFIKTWGRLARGLGIEVNPVHDRVNYLSPRDNPRVLHHLELLQPALPPLLPKDLSGEVYDTIEGVFKVSKAEIDALKLQATMSKDAPNYFKLSTFETFAGHVWRCATKARRLADDQYVKLYVTVDARSRLKDPALPTGYCGNVLFFPSCTAKAKDITHKSLGYVASKIHEMMTRMNDIEYLRSAIDYLESRPNVEPFVRNGDTVTCPNLSINSWSKIPVGGGDFGYGKPQFIRHAGVKKEGQSFIIPDIDEDHGSLSLSIKLFRPHMALFGKYLHVTGNTVKQGEFGTSREAKSRL